MIIDEQRKAAATTRDDVVRQQQLEKYIQVLGMSFNAIGIVLMTIGGAFIGAAACGAGVGAGAAGGACVAFGLSIFVMGVLLSLK